MKKEDLDLQSERLFISSYVTYWFEPAIQNVSLENHVPPKKGAFKKKTVFKRTNCEWLHIAINMHMGLVLQPRNWKIPLGITEK